MRFYLFLLFFLFINHLSAEEKTFYLKSGEIVKGEILEDTNSYFLLKVPFGKIKLDKHQLSESQKPVQQGLSDIKIYTYSKSVQNKIIPKQSQKSASDPLENKEMLNWIMERRSSKTGIFESFFPSSNPMLKNQASTYDQAVTGIALLKMGYLKEAAAIGDFFLSLKRKGSYCNFYHRNSGYPGLEKIAHLGPNSWLGLFFLHLYKQTRNQRYQKGAEDIIKWGRKLNQMSGGFVMGERATGRAPWNKIVSTENNIDFYALLREFIKIIPDKRDSLKYQKSLKQVEEFILNKMINKQKDKYKVYRGLRKEGPDPVEALDNYTWLIAAFGAEYLEEKGFSAKIIVNSFMDKFYAEDSGIIGFDFTDSNERKIIKREPIVSFEWTFGAITAIQETEILYGNNHPGTSNSQFFIQEMNKGFFTVKPEFQAIPYASRGGELIFNDSHWWKTPENGNYGNQCGALISMAWYFLVKSGINPFLL